MAAGGRIDAGAQDRRTYRPPFHEEQAALVITTLPRQPHRRYPRGDDGRADHTVARARVERRLATV